MQQMQPLANHSKHGMRNLEQNCFRIMFFSQARLTQQRLIITILRNDLQASAP